MKNKDTRLVILLIIFSFLTIMHMYFFNKDFSLLNSLVLLFNSVAIAYYAKGIISILQEN